MKLSDSTMSSRESYIPDVLKGVTTKSTNRKHTKPKSRVQKRGREQHVKPVTSDYATDTHGTYRNRNRRKRLTIVGEALKRAIRSEYQKTGELPQIINHNHDREMN